MINILRKFTYAQFALIHYLHWGEMSIFGVFKQQYWKKEMR